MLYESAEICFLVSVEVCRREGFWYLFVIILEGAFLESGDNSWEGSGIGDFCIFCFNLSGNRYNKLQQKPYRMVVDYVAVYS